MFFLPNKCKCPQNVMTYKIATEISAACWAFVIEDSSNIIPILLWLRLPDSLSWNYLRLTYTQKKDVGASPVTRPTVYRLSHCPVSRNEQRRKPHAVYIEPTLAQGIRNTMNQRRCTIHLIGAFPLLCSWLTVLNLRDSYTVKTKAYRYALFVYMYYTHLQTQRSSSKYKSLQKY